MLYTHNDYQCTQTMTYYTQNSIFYTLTTTPYRHPSSYIHSIRLNISAKMPDIHSTFTHILGYLIQKRHLTHKKMHYNLRQIRLIHTHTTTLCTHATAPDTRTTMRYTQTTTPYTHPQRCLIPKQWPLAQINTLSLYTHPQAQHLLHTSTMS